MSSFVAGYFSTSRPAVSHEPRNPTARSLMSRAGVQTEIAERVLGHAQGELIQIYDRHTYQDEMAEALTKLAALLIERILL